MTKVDPGLLHTIARHLDAAPRVRTLAARGAQPEPKIVHIGVEFTGPIGDLLAAGFTPLSLREHPTEGWKIGSGPVDIGLLGELDAIPHVVRIDGSPSLSPLLDESVPMINADL